MKKNKFLLLILVLTFVVLTGCGKEKVNQAAFDFKSDYESLNEKVNASGNEYREVNINEDNKFVEISEDELIKKLENKESFYIYFGSTLCPWCRSVIEVADKISRNNDIDVIYYLDIWDDEGKEIFRDAYVLNDKNKPELVIEGTEGYKKVLEIFDEYLSDYSLTASDGTKVSVGEKRVYAPSFVYILNGKPIRLTKGVSEKQEGPRGELTEEVIAEQQEIFNKFFSNSCNTDYSC